jgi:hypothetical protein
MRNEEGEKVVVCSRLWLNLQSRDTHTCAFGHIPPSTSGPRPSSARIKGVFPD